MNRRLTAEAESFALAVPFTLSRGTTTAINVVTVTITDGIHRGRGEGTPNARYGETAASALVQIEAVRPAVEAGLDREGLARGMAPGAARNAVDCALWDLEAKARGTTVFALAGGSRPRSITTVYTISLAAPEKMAADARAQAHRPILKLKLGGAGDIARIRAVREAVQGIRLVVDANEAAEPASLGELIAAAAEARIELIEQPLPAGEDELLREVEHRVAICADESCHTTADLPRLVGLYDMVNIKLDKAGGLTEALALDAAARAAGLGVMVGSMLSSSLAAAASQVVAAGADIVDLDTPLMLREDRTPAIAVQGSEMAIADPALWG